jgi:uncharacterized protein
MASPASSTQALTLHEQRELLDFAHLALERYLLAEEALLEPPPGALVAPRLMALQGAFVSLHRGRELRGCVGFPEPTRPLVRAVMENTVGAAGRDPRFHPVEGHELFEIAVEISVLGDILPMSPEQVEAGRHGLLIELEGRRGLLLPQVATEHRWSRTDLLRQVCIKAGIHPDAWQRPETRLYAFTAQVFADLAPGPNPPDLP